MPLRWCLCKVQYKVNFPGDDATDWEGAVVSDPATGNPRKAKGRRNRKDPEGENLLDVQRRSVIGRHGMNHVSAISGGKQGEVNDWCLSLVRSHDLTPLDADPDVEDLLGHDYEAGDGFLNESPASMGAQVEFGNIVSRLASKGIDSSGLTVNSKYWEILTRVGMVHQPERRIDIPGGPQNVLWDAGFEPRGNWVNLR